MGASESSLKLSVISGSFSVSSESGISGAFSVSFYFIYFLREALAEVSDKVLLIKDSASRNSLAPKTHISAIKIIFNFISYEVLP